MRININLNLGNSTALLNALGSKQFKFAVAKALTTTAKDAQAAVRFSIPSKFTLRRNWIVNGIRIKAATPETMTSEVFSIDPFMSLQEGGGIKKPMRDKYLAIPTTNVRRTKKDIIRQSELPSKLPNTIIGLGNTKRASLTTNTGEKYMVVLKGKRALRKTDDRFIFKYKLQTSAMIKPRLGLVDTSLQVVKDRFKQNLDASIAYVIATMRR